MSDAWTCLVTGGAGFIGSNLVDALIEQGHEVRVLDDLSTGYAVQLHPDARLIIGAVDDADVVRNAVDGCDVVFHQAAHRAVLRSVEHPLSTDSANTHGTLTVLDAARTTGVRRVIYASSSSVYGGAEVRPTPESTSLLPRSPYAVSKLAGEHYCRVFTELYGLETFALRYFNVYGPRQRPDSQYAAVIPLFIDALKTGNPPTVHGDGKQSRDFTYVSDVVEANIAAASAPAEAAGRAYNIAGGDEHSLLDLLEILGRLLDVEPEPEHSDPRPGDVRHTCAEVTEAADKLDWQAKVSFEDGLALTTAWFSESRR
jgi:UDP-glucose 4-epimerase